MSIPPEVLAFVTQTTTATYPDLLLFTPLAPYVRLSLQQSIYLRLQFFIQTATDYLANLFL
jgi:hypothetical protein